jgi:hypothetical protein
MRALGNGGRQAEETERSGSRGRSEAGRGDGASQPEVLVTGRSKESQGAEHRAGETERGGDRVRRVGGRS